MIEFLGKSPAYWLELQLRLENDCKFNAGDMLGEIVELRGKLSFYESRISQMASEMARK